MSIAEPSPDQANHHLLRSGKVNFNGIVKDVNLAYVPEAVVGDYVIVHVGFALSILDEAEAQKTLDDFSQLDAVY
jgi:hydrogenase expression/formation protein HypC